MTSAGEGRDSPGRAGATQRGPAGAPRRDWDADTYDRVAAPQEEWGREVLARLDLRGDETVLDAGCGSGRVTRLLLERLPHGHVVAVDASEEMVRKARATLGPEVTVIRADLTELQLDDPVDAVFSSAVFHWIDDHPRLFTRLRGALRPGGRLVAQCGGEGNVGGFLEHVRRVGDTPPFADHVGGWDGNWRFVSPAAAAEALSAAGFEAVDCRLEHRPALLAEPRDFLRSVCLGAHLERLPASLHDRFVDTVLDSVGEPVRLDYVRLNLDARKP